jgi:hypothetical protein
VAEQMKHLDTGNLVSDPLYLALDALYMRGWNDGNVNKRDARGTNEWQAVLDLFRSRPAAVDVPDGWKLVPVDVQAIEAVVEALRKEGEFARGVGWPMTKTRCNEWADKLAAAIGAKE